MTEIDLAALFSKEKCFWCEGIMFDADKLEPYPDLLARFKRRLKTRDHIIPRAHGGVGFTVPCCYSCNHVKGSMDPMKFRDKCRPHVPVEKVVQAMLDAKFASASVVPPTIERKKRVTRRRRVIR